MALFQLLRLYNQVHLTSLLVLIPSQQYIKFIQTSGKSQPYFHLSLLGALRNRRAVFLCSLTRVNPRAWFWLKELDHNLCECQSHLGVHHFSPCSRLSKTYQANEAGQLYKQLNILICALTSMLIIKTIYISELCIGHAWMSKKCSES